MMKSLLVTALFAVSALSASADVPPQLREDNISEVVAAMTPEELPVSMESALPTPAFRERQA